MEAYIILGILGYALGSISFSVIFSKKFAGFDVREKGSKNAGTTNVLRTVGKGVAALTLICDVLKGVIAVLLASLAYKIWNDIDLTLAKTVAGFMAIVGHTFPVYFGFRGGKGVATSLGVLLMLNWKIGLFCLVVALIAMIITKMVSVGSIIAAILYPILVIFWQEGNTMATIIFSFLIAGLVIFNHRSNVKRLLTGTENKIDFKKTNK